MGKALTPAQEHSLAEQSASIAARIDAQQQHVETPLRGRRDVSERELPWYVRHLAQLIVGGIFAGVALLAFLVVAVVNLNGGDQAEMSNKLVDVVKQQNEVALKRAEVDLERAAADLIRSRLEADRLERQEADAKKREEAIRKKAEEERAKQQAFYGLLLFCALIIIVGGFVAWQFDGLWGLSIGAVVVGLVVIVASGVIPVELIRLIMKGS